MALTPASTSLKSVAVDKTIQAFRSSGRDKVDSRMNGWIDGWMGGWTDEWMVRKMNYCVVRLMKKTSRTLIFPDSSILGKFPHSSGIF